VANGSFLEKMTPRERLLVQGFFVFLLIVALFYMIRMITSRRDQLHEEALLSGQKVEKMLRLERQISSLPPAKEIPDRNQLKAQVFSLLDKNGLKGDIQDGLESVSRTEEILIENISINGTPLHPVVNFLYDIEYGGSINATIGNFQFRKPLPDREIYDVKISVTVRRPKGKP